MMAGGEKEESGVEPRTLSTQPTVLPYTYAPGGCFFPHSIGQGRGKSLEAVGETKDSFLKTLISFMNSGPGLGASGQA